MYIPNQKISHWLVNMRWNFPFTGQLDGNGLWYCTTQRYNSKTSYWPVNIRSGLFFVFVFSIKIYCAEAQSLCTHNNWQGSKGSKPLASTNQTWLKLWEPRSSPLSATQWWAAEEPGYPNLFRTCSPIIPETFNICGRKEGTSVWRCCKWDPK